MKAFSLKDYRLKRFSEGFFSIEMIAVLVVALLILATGAGRVAQLFTSSNNASAAGNILSLETSVQTLRSVDGYGATGTDLLSLLKDGNSIPSTLSQSGDKIINEWGGEVKVASENEGLGFSITYPSVPTNAAASLVNQLMIGGAFSGVNIDSKVLPAPVSPSDVAQALKGKTSVDIVFLVGSTTADSSPQAP